MMVTIEIKLYDDQNSLMGLELTLTSSASKTPLCDC